MTDTALALLPAGETLHCFRQSVSGIAFGAVWPRERLVAAVQKARRRARSPREMASVGHGLVIEDEKGRLWVETRNEFSQKQGK
jgi:hypothetical protein